MSDLRELYQETILDHNRSPRNFRKMENATRTVEGFNPLCGDHLHLYLLIENNRLKDVAFEGKGCAISKASASLMSAELKNKTTEEAREIFERFHQMVTAEMEEKIDLHAMGKLAAFSGIREFPVRVKCAILPWRTLEAGLAGDVKSVSTE
jgi:nitrogen fixation NifU-like protein